MVGRMMPDVIGEVPGGGWVRLRSLEGKPVTLVLFRPGAPYARELVVALGRLRHEPAFSEAVFLGVSIDSPENTERFIAMTGDALPTLRDPGPIAKAFGVEDTALVLIDPRRFVRYRLDGFAGPQFRERLDAAIQAVRRLPSLDALAAREIKLQYTKDPRAPLFTAKDLNGRMVDLAALRGHVVAVQFFDQDSPECRQDLPRLVPVLRELRSVGVAAIGITSRDADGGLRRYLQEHGIDYPVVIDADRSIFRRYGSTRTPDLFLIDGLGFVRFREAGERTDRAERTRIQVEMALGRETSAAQAASLQDGGETFKSGVAHVGADACRDCHRKEYDQWIRTPHAAAYALILRDGRGADPSCTACHTTGSGLPGGFGDTSATVSLTGVQCEVCHGPGDDHVAVPAALKRETIYGITRQCSSCTIPKVCTTCHDAKNDPDFEFESALAKVTH